MATEHLKSGAITNRDASPKVLSNSILGPADLKEVVGFVEAGASDTSSTLRFAQIPSNARVSQVLIYSDDVGATGDIDVGIYQTTENGGAVVDADHFASALDVNAAALNGVDIAHESGVYGLEDAEKPLWQALGLSADPGIMYDVVATPTEAFGTGGTICLKIRYAI